MPIQMVFILQGSAGWNIPWGPLKFSGTSQGNINKHGVFTVNKFTDNNYILFLLFAASN